MTPEHDEHDEHGGSGEGSAASRRLRVLTGALVVVGFALFAFGVWRGFGGDDGGGTTVGADGGRSGATTTAQRSLAIIADVARMVGDACLELLVADTVDERAQGLRHQEFVLDEVDGMLFLYDAPQSPVGTFFTMAGVVEPLEVGFYDASGAYVGGHRMEPCDGSVGDCPRYPPPAPFVAAIETEPGELPEGPLGDECRPEEV